MIRSSAMRNLPRAIGLTSRAGGERRAALLAAVTSLKAADPRIMVKGSVQLKGKRLRVKDRELNLGLFGRVLVIGGGKASALMAEAIEDVLGDVVTEGRVIVPEAQRPLLKLSRIRFRRSTHPWPTRKGVRAVDWMLDSVKEPELDDLVFCLISGGGSALMPMPAGGVTVEDKLEVTRLLQQSGADIGEQNCVRKHLSAINGGRLAERLRPARVFSLIISDVVGNHLASVASGPTVPDPTTYAQAKKVLTRMSLWREVPEAVRTFIQSGVAGSAPETPKPGSKVFSRVRNVLIGSNEVPCDAARMTLASLGYKTSVISTRIEGEARKFGDRLASLAIGAGRRRRAVALVAGGETTVHVTGTGVGGRNQEVALAAAMRMAGAEGAAVVSFGTDGVDGPTRAAGAIADSGTVLRGERLGMEAGDYLRNNDSHSYFRRLGDLLVTGPTGTNVNDVMIAVVRRR